MSRGLSKFRAPEPQTLSQWADEHFYLSAESSYVQGRWETLPYQKPIMDCISHDDVREVTWIKSARVGFSKCIVAAVGYFAEHKRRNQALWQPVDDDADEFVKTEINPMLRDCERVREVFPWHNRRSQHNTLSQKKFIGSMLHIRGGKSAKNYRRITVDVAYVDELDAFDRDIEGEGDPITLASKRVEGSTFPKVVLGSTPRIRNQSYIEDRAQLAEYFFRFYVPCPYCGDEHYLVWGGKNAKEGLYWDEDNPKDVRHRCGACGDGYTQSEYMEVWKTGRCIDKENGVYIDRDGQFRALEGDELLPPPYSVAFHVWTAYSPFTSWPQIVKEFMAAKADPLKLKGFVNTTLGETWQERGEAPDWRRLYDRREPYKRGTVPMGGLMLTAAADVQGGQNARVEIEVKAWGRFKECWSVDHIVIPGDFTENVVKEEVARVLDTQYRHEAGVNMLIERFGIDSGYNTQEVYTFCRAQGVRRVMALRGQDGLRSVLAMPTVVDINRSGKKVRRGVQVWNIGVSVLKEELYRLLRLEPPTKEEIEDGAVYPPGYCHYPEEYTDEWFRQLCSEMLLQVKNRRGFVRYEWEKTRERNEALDLHNYNRAVAESLGLGRMSEKDWLSREKDLRIVRDAKPQATERVLAQPKQAIKVETKRQSRKRRTSGYW